MIASLTIEPLNSRLTYQSKQIWKRSCKKASDNYNAIPSLNNWLPEQVRVSDLLFEFDWRLQSSHLYFLAIARSLQRKIDQVLWGAARAAVAQGNLGESPCGGHRRQKINSNWNVLPEGSSRVGEVLSARRTAVRFSIAQWSVKWDERGKLVVPPIETLSDLFTGFADSRIWNLPST